MISRNRLQHWMVYEFSWRFFNEYNHIHRHSGIAWHTAYVANPARFSRRPSPPEMSTVDFINEPVAESQIN